MKIIRSVFTNSAAAVTLTATLLLSCGGEKSDEGSELLDDGDTIKSSVLNVAGELFSVPSPIQTAMLIQKSGITYDKNVLSRHQSANNFSTDFSRALNLGIYGADLGYVSLYSQTQDALGYLASLKQLSDKLGLSAAFDPATMERIRNNITNRDSMMVLVGIAYRGSDAYLKDNQRTDISSLILTGGWIESMHFSIMAYRSKPTDQIRYRIAEQKQALGSIIKILKNNSDNDITALAESLAGLQKIYDSIQFKYNFVEPTHDTIKKVTYINSTTEVIITDEQLSRITEKVKEIRDKIVNASQS
jgi:hypothetical protein